MARLGRGRGRTHGVCVHNGVWGDSGGFWCDARCSGTGGRWERVSLRRGLVRVIRSRGEPRRWRGGRVDIDSAVADRTRLA